MKMGKVFWIFLMLVLCISAFGIFPKGSQAITTIPDDQYWRIDETIDEPGIFPFYFGTLTITNMHQADIILGFAVGVPDDTFLVGVVDENSWNAFLADNNSWANTNQPSPVDSTLESWFGSPFTNAFPGHNYAAVFWSTTGAGIMAGTSSIDRHFYEFDGLSASPAIIRMDTSGSFLGSTDINNFFGTPIPEPNTVFLLGTGLLALAGFRRKFKKQ